jgi:hypothetical protein
VAASYPALIELRVNGITQVTRVLDTIQKLDAALVSIKNTPIAIDSGNATDGIRVLKKEYMGFVAGLSQGKTQLASTTAGINQQAAAMRLLAANAKIGGQAFNLLVQGAEQARQKVSLTAGLAEIAAVASQVKVGRTAPTQSYKGVQELLRMETSIAKNTASLDLFQQELRQTLSFVDMGSKDFRELSQAIDRVGLSLDVASNKARKFGPALPPGFTEAGATKSKTTKGGGPNVGGAVSSALIGGGFPLLFGQGPGAAAGGALGGVAGGLLGGGFGFALSIVGTALGDIITKAEAFDKSLAALNTGLSTTGSTSITTANDVSKLASSLNVTKEEAIELVNTFKQFKDGDTREALAGLFGPVGGAATFEAIAKAGVDEKNALAAIFSLRKEIGNDAALQLALQLKSVGASTTQASLLKIILDRSIEISVAQASQVNFTDRLLSIWEGIVAGVAQALSLATRFIAKMQEGSLIKLPFLDKIIAALGGFEARTPGDIAKERGEDVAAQLKAEQDRIRKALAEETRVAGTENALGQQLKQDAKSPVDRASALRQIQKEFYADQLKILAINVQQVAILEGEEAALQRQAALNEANARIRGTILSIERETALQEAAKTGTVAEVVRLYEQRRKILQDELDIQNEATRAQAAQIQLDKFVATQQAVQTAVKPFEDLRVKQEQETQAAKTYSRLLQEGILPAEAERRANFDKLVSAQLRSLDIEIAIQKSIIQQAISYGVTIQKVLELQEALKNMEAARAAVTGEAATGPGAGPTDRERLQTEADRVRGELNTLTDPINAITTAAAGIGDAFAMSFKGIIDGSMTAKEALGSFFKSVADMFLEMAAQIIAKQITMIILQTILKALGAVGGGGGVPGANSASALGTNPNVAAYAPLANGGTFANGIASFANGGAFTNSVVSSPTMFKFADGGAMRTGLMGEAGPEAIMPLSRGADGSLGVQANGLREAMDRQQGGGSGSPVLNMSFQSTSINGVEYVSRDQLESAMAETRRNATRDGAKRGMTMTLDRIQNSSSTRRKVGI